MTIEDVRNGRRRHVHKEFDSGQSNRGSKAQAKKQNNALTVKLNQTKR